MVKNPPANEGDVRPSFHPWVGKIPWSWAWQPTPVLLPGESHGQRSLAGYSPWGRISGQKRAHGATRLVVFHQLEPSENQWLCVVLMGRRGTEGGKADVPSPSSQHENLQTHVPPWGWGGGSPHTADFKPEMTKNKTWK